MTIKISNNEVAVDTDYYWLPMNTCPRGVKVQLLGEGGVACYGAYSPKDTFWRAWAPLPKERRDAAATAGTTAQPCEPAAAHTDAADGDDSTAA